SGDDVGPSPEAPSFGAASGAAAASCPLPSGAASWPPAAGGPVFVASVPHAPARTSPSPSAARTPCPIEERPPPLKTPRADCTMQKDGNEPTIQWILRVLAFKFRAAG